MDNKNDLMKEIEFLKKRVEYLERRSGGQYETMEIIWNLLENLAANIDELKLRIKND